VRAAEDERLLSVVVVEEEMAFEGLRTFMFLPPPLVALWYPLVDSFSLPAVPFA
jgi:hypothetical protein